VAQRSVRAARATDAAAIGRVQLRTWHAAYADVLPARLLAIVTADDLAEQWSRAATMPPSPRHRVLVALDETSVVGFVAFGPGDDPDLESTIDAELHALHVDPDAGRRGHGSRLLAAAVDTMRGDGFRRAYAWLLAGDDVSRRFLAAAGWAPDGGTRDLDLTGAGEAMAHQVRLHTDFGERSGGARSGGAR
jgi:ribosomal protein S18 acetylase RimI-like enzyme